MLQPKMRLQGTLKMSLTISGDVLILLKLISLTGKVFLWVKSSTRGPKWCKTCVAFWSLVFRFLFI